MLQHREVFIRLALQYFTTNIQTALTGNEIAMLTQYIHNKTQYIHNKIEDMLCKEWDLVSSKCNLYIHFKML
jgi:hypothetical protein